MVDLGQGRLPVRRDGGVTQQRVPPVTGDPEVDAVLARLDAADDVPTEQQADVFDDVHRALQDALDSSS